MARLAMRMCSLVLLLPLLHMVVESYPITVCNVLDYGAVGDNATVNTFALQQAIDACSSYSPFMFGQVLFPDDSGVFLTGALFLRSNIYFTIGRNVVLKGAWLGWDKTFELFPWMYTRSNGYMMFSHASLINAGFCVKLSDDPHALGDQCVEWEKVENVVIEGPGTIDGNGGYWWDCATTAEFVANQSCPDGTNFTSQRPSAMAPLWVDNLTIRNLNVHNSAFWSIHPTFSNNVLVENVSVYAPADSYNTDGCDPDSCTNVTLRNMHIDVGDDCIALNSGKDLDGRLVGIPTVNVTVENIVCLHGHGLSIGSGMSGNISDVIFRNAVCNGTLNGPRIKTMRGRGGVVENVVYENIQVSNIVQDDIQITMFYKPNVPPTNASATPSFRNFTFKNITGTSAETSQSYAGIALGLPESPIVNFTFINVKTEGYNPWVCCNAYGTLVDSPDVCINETIPRKYNDVYDLLQTDPEKWNAFVNSDQVESSPERDCETADLLQPSYQIKFNRDI